MVPLSGLSLGYQTTLTWIADLALRLYEQYPDSSDPLSEPGIVLIDEIELHLHPRWQRRMMEDLSRWFPNLQFIATAHSPLVVQAAEGGNLAILQERNGEASIEMHSESVSEWRADQILASDLFGIPSRSRSIEKLIEERNTLLDMADRKPEDEIRLCSLEKKLDTLRTAKDPDDQAAMDLIPQGCGEVEGWRMEQVMIRIQRPPEPPGILENAGTRMTRELCEEYDRDGDAYRRGSKPFNFSRNVYGHDSVKQSLSEVQREKCCYCESRLGVTSHKVVEHFRPKGAVQQDSRPTDGVPRVLLVGV